MRFPLGWMSLLYAVIRLGVGVTVVGAPGFLVPPYSDRAPCASFSFILAESQRVMVLTQPARRVALLWTLMGRCGR